jgi:hypothetical protein
VTLHVACESHRLPTIVGTDDAIASLEAKVGAMRRLGVTKWGDIELGPAPLSDADDDIPAQRVDAAKAEQERRDRVRRIALASSGGPLKPVERI